MCRKKTTKVKVKIPADLSSTGNEKRKFCEIDFCIAPIVKALQQGGIDMRGSCCGHHQSEGDIHLQDGRAILILDKTTAQKYIRNRKGGTDIRAFIRSEIR